MKKKASIIIRTKNEERWIVRCLDAISKQTYDNYEVIIVDNCSEDKTLERAKKYKKVKKIVSIKKYLPGKSLNVGIRSSSGEYIVCISSHCIPVDKFWLANLVNAIEEDNNYAGVYGRQEPMSFSSPSDKRDLMIVFGLDRKIQLKDSFFHNANSIIKRSVWNKFPFSEKTTNIEDRLWAQKILKKGYKILYEPKASVFHYHGIHQGGKSSLLNNVVSILQKNTTNYRTGKLNPKNMKIAAIIPIKGEPINFNGKLLIKKTINTLKQSKYVDDIIISTDSKNTAKIAKKLGVSCPFLRPKNLSQSHVNLETVQQFSLIELEKKNFFYDLIVHVEETFPFRPKNFIDDMIKHFLKNGLNTVVATKNEPKPVWHEKKQNTFERIDSGDVPREFKEKIFVGMPGLGLITYPELVRKQKIFDQKVGFFQVKSPIASIEVRDKEGFEVAKKLLKI